MVENNKVQQIMLNMIMILLTFICVMPFVLLVASSLTSEKALMVNGYNFFPKEFSAESYKYLISHGQAILRGYGITVLATVAGTLCSISITLLLAYPLSRKEMIFRPLFSFIVFFTMLFNGGLVPTYLMYTGIFHIKNTLFALIVPNLLMNAFFVIMMRSFFSSNIADSLIEAARIDGAGEYRILWSIVIPLSKPMITTLMLMVGLNYWNDWLNGLYYLTDPSLFSIQNILNRMLSDIQFLSSGSSLVSNLSAATLPSIGIRMAIAVIGILPVLVLYPFFQKNFVKGIVIGGVKG
jgi:putative aldouronate transport system permease protein